MQGFVALHRKIRKSAVFNDLELYRLWSICLTEASHKEHQILVGRQSVTLQRGQFLTGRFDLHRMYNEGLKAKNFVSEKTVWRWLETLQKLENVTINSTNKFSIVTVVNWDLYQFDDQHIDQQVTNKRPTNDQQVTTNNNGNKGNKGKEEKKYYLEHVKMTEKEYTTLLDIMTEKERDDYMERFNVWITGQSETVRKKRDAYLSIRKWYKDAKEKQPSPSIHQPVRNYSYSAKDREAELLQKAIQNSKNAQVSMIDFGPRTD